MGRAGPEPDVGGGALVDRGRHGPADRSGGFRHTGAVTEPSAEPATIPADGIATDLAAEPADMGAEMADMGAEPGSVAAEPATAARSPWSRPSRLRVLPALLVASMLVAGGLLMAVGGMVRLVEPAPATPSPTIAATPATAGTPAPAVVPVPAPSGPAG